MASPETLIDHYTTEKESFHVNFTKLEFPPGTVLRSVLVRPDLTMCITVLNLRGICSIIDYHVKIRQQNAWKNLIEDGTPEESLSDSAAEKVHKYLLVRHYGKKVTVTFNEKAIAAQKKYHGYFALVSNCEKDPFECLRKYRRRETIEFFFESGKQKTDGYRTRVWSSECLMGRMFVQFVSLCYYEYLSEQLRQLKQSLAAEIGSEDDTEHARKAKKKLLSWLNNTPVYLILQWFDAVEEVKVSAKLLAKRWTTEITERDQMFLEKLGVPAF